MTITLVGEDDLIVMKNEGEDIGDDGHDDDLNCFSINDGADFGFCVDCVLSSGHLFAYPFLVLCEDPRTGLKSQHCGQNTSNTKSLSRVEMCRDWGPDALSKGPGCSLYRLVVTKTHTHTPRTRTRTRTRARARTRTRTAQ